MTKPRKRSRSRVQGGARRTSPDPIRVTDAEIDRQGRAAERRQAALERSGLVATSAHYDAPAGRVMIELSSGTIVGVPVRAIASLDGATPDELAGVGVDAIGSSLRWDTLDADVSVPGILFKQFGYSAVRKSAASAGGRVRSEAKAAAARANGKHGGRPRKVRAE